MLLLYINIILRVARSLFPGMLARHFPGSHRSTLSLDKIVKISYHKTVAIGDGSMRFFSGKTPRS